MSIVVFGTNLQAVGNFFYKRGYQKGQTGFGDSRVFVLAWKQDVDQLFKYESDNKFSIDVK